MRLVGVTARALALSLVITAPLLVGCAKPEGAGSVPATTQGAPSTGGAASTH